MDGIELMVKEHEYIKEGIELTRKACFKIIDEDFVDTSFFNDALTFFINYADKHHHGKEEEILFDYLKEAGGDLEKNLINAMEIEHNWGRLLLQDLENALDEYNKGNKAAKLDIIGNAVGYTNLLTRHIDKEDNALFKHSKKTLGPNKLAEFNKQVENFENSSENQANRDKYIKLLENLKQKI